MKAEHIDLSLAVNYIPACSCVLRLGVYLFIQGLTTLYDDSRLFVVLGTLLYMDRVLQARAHFFDSNSILYTVFFAHVFQAVRDPGTNLQFSVLLVYFLWGGCGAFFLWDHGFLHKVANRLYLPLDTVQVWLSMLPILYILFSGVEEEVYVCGLFKAFSFVILVIMWIYIIGLKYAALHTHAYVVRFLPILILPIWMAAMQTMLSLVIILLHLRDRLRNDGEATEDSVASHLHVTHTQAPAPPAVEDDVEAMFRMAKAQAHG